MLGEVVVPLTGGVAIRTDLDDVHQLAAAFHDGPSGLWALPSLAGQPQDGDPASPLTVVVAPDAPAETVLSALASLDGTGQTIGLADPPADDPSAIVARTVEIGVADPADFTDGVFVDLQPEGVGLYVDGERMAGEACETTTLCAAEDWLSTWQALEHLVGGLLGERPDLDHIALDCGDVPAGLLMAAIDALQRADGENKVPAPSVRLAFLLRQPCVPPPEGMACVAGGPHRVATPDDGPGHDVYLPTYYVDLDELEDATGTTQREMSLVCARNGKRLPTEWEWEKAAGEADDLGLTDMAGGAAEWTATWGRRKRDCGEACRGVNPLGPCDGFRKCSGHHMRVSRGGDRGREDEPPSLLTRALLPEEESDRYTGGRCFSTTPYLTGSPPASVANPYPEPPPLAPPSEEMAELFHSVVEDDLEAKPICEGEDVGGRSSLNCRDPYTYVRGNEPRIDLYSRYITNLGGGYVGVGSDQNYSFAAAARSEWVWFMDYDPNVVHVHRVNQALIPASETPEQFVARWSEEGKEEAIALIEARWLEGPEQDRYVHIYKRFRRTLLRWYTRCLAPPKEHIGLGQIKVPEGDPEFGWLRNPDHYQYVRTLFTQGRVSPVGGDMLADGCLRAIGDTAREMGIPIRIYYTSNAPYAWNGTFPQPYRTNCRNLPMDSRSVVLQLFGFSTGFHQRGYWHYNVQHGLQQQAFMGLQGCRHLKSALANRIPGHDADLTLAGLPGAPVAQQTP